MKDVTLIGSTSWMFNLGGKVLTKFSEVDITKPMKYRENSIMAKVHPQYGPSDWNLPAQLTPISTTHPQFYRLFAKMILDGEVFSSMKGWKYSMKTTEFLKVGNLSFKVTTIPRKLKREAITNKSELK